MDRLALPTAARNIASTDCKWWDMAGLLVNWMNFFVLLQKGYSTQIVHEGHEPRNFFWSSLNGNSSCINVCRYILACFDVNCISIKIWSHLLGFSVVQTLKAFSEFSRSLTESAKTISTTIQVEQCLIDVLLHIVQQLLSILGPSLSFGSDVQQATLSSSSQTPLHGSVVYLVFQQIHSTRRTAPCIPIASQPSR